MTLVRTHHIFSLRLPIDGRLNCSAIVSDVAMNTGVQESVSVPTFDYLQYVPRSHSQIILVHQLMSWPCSSAGCVGRTIPTILSVLKLTFW